MLAVLPVENDPLEMSSRRLEAAVFKKSGTLLLRAFCPVCCFWAAFACELRDIVCLSSWVLSLRVLRPALCCSGSWGASSEAYHSVRSSTCRRLLGTCMKSCTKARATSPSSQPSRRRPLTKPRPLTSKLPAAAGFPSILNTASARSTAKLLAAFVVCCSVFTGISPRPAATRGSLTPRLGLIVEEAASDNREKYPARTLRALHRGLSGWPAATPSVDGRPVGRATLCLSPLRAAMPLWEPKLALEIPSRPI
mmetsp:Transcript_14209/g.35656  ORF Transcript_14209/g.35656 Transcript_14209/m.35656 type:complete len:252 (+) Transcript_14209:188-943(+)